jgi:acyl dehydratase
MMALYYEDFQVGDHFTSPGRTVTEADLTLFSGLSGDYNPLHTDEEFAKNTSYGKRIAHGALGFAIVTGLIDRLQLFNGSAIAFLGIENWQFVKPIFIGDTIHFEMVILNKRKTSTIGRGIIQQEVRLLNHLDEMVHKGNLNIMVKCREVEGEICHPTPY